LKGDVTKLLFAHGITQEQKQLLRNLQFVGSQISGVQGTRIAIGRCMFGGHAVYGLPLFLTISHNERYSSLVLRVSRYRKNDPLLLHSQLADVAALRQCASKDYPSLCAPRGRSENDEDVVVDIPMYDMRRALLAKDCVSIVTAFQVYIRIVLARLLGVRMCPLCPQCNARGSANPCQDRFGSNATPLGGILGRVDAIAGVVEHQGQGTPHFHVCVHVQRLHQSKTLVEIADLIKNLPGHFDALKEYQSWVCREEQFDKAQHDAEIPEIEREWPSYKTRASNKLCVLPAFLASASYQGLWNRKKCKAFPPPSDTAPGTVLREHASSGIAGWVPGGPALAGATVSAYQDAATWRKRYSEHVQYVFSRVQHHYHKKDPKTLRRTPLNACRKKGPKKDACKHDFPKLDQLNNVGVKVVCKGVAARFKLSLKGRRGALGSLLGKRDDMWHTGTCPALAAFCSKQQQHHRE